MRKHQTNLRDTLPSFFKSVKVMKDKEGMRNYLRFKSTKMK